MVVVFYFVLFCYVLFAVRVRSAPGAHTFCHLGTAFRSLHMLRFGFGSRLFKVLIIHGPGPFWLREPALKEECYYRSGTVLGSGSQA